MTARRIAITPENAAAVRPRAIPEHALPCDPQDPVDYGRRRGRGAERGSRRARGQERAVRRRAPARGGERLAASALRSLWAESRARRATPRGVRSTSTRGVANRLLARPARLLGLAEERTTARAPRRWPMRRGTSARARGVLRPRAVAEKTARRGGRPESPGACGSPARRRATRRGHRGLGQVEPVSRRPRGPTSARLPPVGATWTSVGYCWIAIFAASALPSAGDVDADHGDTLGTSFSKGSERPRGPSAAGHAPRRVKVEERGQPGARACAARIRVAPWPADAGFGPPGSRRAVCRALRGRGTTQTRTTERDGTKDIVR